MHCFRRCLVAALALSGLAGCTDPDARPAGSASAPAQNAAAAPAEAAPTAAGTEAGTTHVVRMLLEGGLARFEPASLTIRAGDSVRFVNAAGGPHNVSFDPAAVPDEAERVLAAAMPGQIQPLVGPFVTEPNASYAISFAGVPPGRYAFFCLPHRGMGMTGQIVVEAGAGSAAAGANPAAPATAAPPAAPAPVRLGIGRSARHGVYVADAGGRALYLLEDNRPCYDACMGVWPPLLAAGAGAAAANPALQRRLVGTLRRRDGTLQVTYGGHPLYYYVGDRNPGDTEGQLVEDSWGEWYLVAPDGAEVETEGRRGGRDRRHGS